MEDLIKAGTGQLLLMLLISAGLDIKKTVSRDGMAIGKRELVA